MDPNPLITTSVLTALLPQPTTSLLQPTTSLLQLTTSLLQLTTFPQPTTSLQTPTTHSHIHMVLRFRPRLPLFQLVDLVRTDPAVIQAAMSMETTLTSPKCKLHSNQDSTEPQPKHLASNHTPTSTPPPHPMEQQVPSTNPRQTRVFMAQTLSLNPSSKYLILLEPTEELERVVLQVPPKTHSVQASHSEALAV